MLASFYRYFLFIAFHYEYGILTINERGFIMNQSFLYQILNQVSVSGHEFTLQKYIMDEMKDECDACLKDHTGTLIHVHQPKQENKILLCAHVDEIGFYVENITNDGFLKLSKAGGIHPILYLGTHVQIKHGDQIVPGCIITNSNLEKNNNLTADQLLVDIGTSSKEESMRYIKIGDPVCAATSYQELANNRLCARALDDRIGAFIILEALKKAKQYGCENGIYAATTVGEETTMRGANATTRMVSPNCAVIVDVTFASDYPNAVIVGDIQLGKGAVLCNSSIVNQKLNQKMEQIANQYNLPIQWESAPGRTGTDGDIIHVNKGIPTVLVSIPLRYMHSSVEVVDLNDVEVCIELIARFLCELESDFNYLPF